ncbi:carbohydrate-binding module family 1 protein [Mycena floridula]|nr:carbohydrate-binding module family 1 protein [Mycena floridula]
MIQVALLLSSLLLLASWGGATLCPSGWGCSVINPYYSQCLPGVATSTTGTTSTTGSSSTTSAPAGATPTLVSGYSFIRAVFTVIQEDPNFHKYLRSETINAASDAVLGEPVTAAQFQITGGQLIQNAGGTPLYAVVEPRANSTVMKLKMSWSTTPATTGTFVFSGDTVEWSNPSITRPQNNAWLICPDSAGNKLVYINLGAYSYMTPAGCADETIHSYSGSTPTA